MSDLTLTGNIDSLADLAGLPDSWRVLSATDCDDAGHTDHLIVGPGGVFTITTKSLPHSSAQVSTRAITVDGHRAGYLGKARAEARRVADMLRAGCGFSVDVRGTLVLDDLDHITVDSQPVDIYVTTAQRLQRWLTSLPPRLHAQQIERICSYAKTSLTWQPAFVTAPV